MNLTSMMSCLGIETYQFQTIAVKVIDFTEHKLNHGPHSHSTSQKCQFLIDY